LQRCHQNSSNNNRKQSRFIYQQQQQKDTMTGQLTTGGPRWSGLETPGMREAKCSLLIPEEVFYDAKIKALPKQRVLVYQDKGFHPASPDNFYVDFKGATILQLEPTGAQKTMPITLTVGGRCVLTPENYQDFRVMMRSKTQSTEMNIAPNGNFDWPDVNALLLCPSCGQLHALPQAHERPLSEYWMVFYPLLQITVMKGSQLTLGTRTICRLVCLECMDDLLEGLTLRIQPGKSSSSSTVPSTTSTRPSTRLCFTLPVTDVLAEAGSASFLEDGPPRPDTHPHVDDVLDAWTLYNLWEHSGAWEALQNDYRVVLSRSLNAADTSNTNNANSDTNNSHDNSNSNKEPRLKERMGKPCGHRTCGKVHGRTDHDGETIRLAFKCRDCLSEVYCSKACRDAAREDHGPECMRKQRDREERRERKAKKVQCDTCEKKFPFTKMKKCSRCRQATYCSVECQKADWDRHRLSCQIR
jgi:hypothetical protein